MDVSGEVAFITRFPASSTKPPYRFMNLLVGRGGLVQLERRHVWRVAGACHWGHRQDHREERQSRWKTSSHVDAQRARM